MAKKRKDDIAPSFTPNGGVTVYKTVKDSLLLMLNRGDFDDATSAVIAWSSRDSVQTSQMGNRFECIALSAVLHQRAINTWEQS